MPFGGSSTRRMMHTPLPTNTPTPKPAPLTQPSQLEKPQLAHFEMVSTKDWRIADSLMRPNSATMRARYWLHGTQHKIRSTMVRKMSQVPGPTAPGEEWDKMQC